MKMYKVLSERPGRCQTKKIQTHLKRVYHDALDVYDSLLYEIVKEILKRLGTAPYLLYVMS